MSKNRNVTMICAVLCLVSLSIFSTLGCGDDTTAADQKLAKGLTTDLDWNQANWNEARWN